MGVNSSEGNGSKKPATKSIAIAIAAVLVILVLVIVIAKVIGKSGKEVTPETTSTESVEFTSADSASEDSASVDSTSSEPASADSSSEDNEDVSPASESDNETPVSDDTENYQLGAEYLERVCSELTATDSMKQFLEGNSKASFLCDFIDYSVDDAPNYNGKSVTVNELLKMNSFDEEGEPTGVKTSIAAYTKNDSSFLLIKFEPENYDNINTYIILEKEDGLHITYVQNSYARYSADFGQGYFKLEGSEGATDTSNEYWEIADDGSVNMIAREDYFGTGCIEDKSTDYMSDGYISSELGYYSPSLSQAVVDAAQVLDEGDDLTISFLTYKGYEGIMGWIEGNVTADVKAFKDTATADGVTWVDNYDSITDAVAKMMASLNLTESCNWISNK